MANRTITDSMHTLISDIIDIHDNGLVTGEPNPDLEISEVLTYHFRELLKLSLDGKPRTLDNPDFIWHAYWYAIYQTMNAIRLSNITPTATPSGDMFQIDEEDNM